MEGRIGHLRTTERDTEEDHNIDRSIDSSEEEDNEEEDNEDEDEDTGAQVTRQRVKKKTVKEPPKKQSKKPARRVSLEAKTKRNDNKVRMSQDDREKRLQWFTFMVGEHIAPHVKFLDSKQEIDEYAFPFFASAYDPKTEEEEQEMKARWNQYYREVPGIIRQKRNIVISTIKKAVRSKYGEATWQI